MDAESLITFILFIVFFILPSVFKQIQALKKKGAQKTKPKKPSVFGQIRQYIYRLEEQAQKVKQARQAGSRKPAEDIWAMLKGGEPDGVEPESLSFPEPEPELKEEKIRTEPDPVPEKPVIPPQAHSAAGMSRRRKKKQRSSGPGRFKRNQLQNAVVWSEILSRPVGLRSGHPVEGR